MFLLYLHWFPPIIGREVFCFPLARRQGLILLLSPYYRLIFKHLISLGVYMRFKHFIFTPFILHCLFGYSLTLLLLLGCFVLP